MMNNASVVMHEISCSSVGEFLRHSEPDSFILLHQFYQLVSKQFVQHCIETF